MFMIDMDSCILYYCEYPTFKSQDFANTIEAALFHLLSMHECSFHMGCMWVLVNLSMIKFEGKFCIGRTNNALMVVYSV